ncbi:Enkurin domain-containing protein 1 [Taenia crassiceps]|uniref:Enkurin domain-containing protein 1 n=1 Tax=Taenia crassiceps TaxID=6207 RepID=A0ABR4QBU5_9CEST
MDQDRGLILNLLQWQNIPGFGSAGYSRRSASVGRDFIRENIRRVRSSVSKPLPAMSSSRIYDPTKIRKCIVERYLGDIGHDQNQPAKMEFCNIQPFQRNLNYMRTNANAVSSDGVLDRRFAKEQSKHSSSSQRGNLGRLPPYLLRRRKEEKEAAIKRAEERSMTPKGYRRLSEEEREDTLRSLEEAHTKTLEELNRVPLHTSTSRAQNLRAQLENRLSNIEEVIRVFHKPVVFITLN